MISVLTELTVNLKSRKYIKELSCQKIIGYPYSKRMMPLPTVLNFLATTMKQITRKELQALLELGHSRMNCFKGRSHGQECIL